VTFIYFGAAKMVVVMVMVIRLKVDKQGRILIPKDIRERKGLKGEVEVVEVEEGLLIRPFRKSWDNLFAKKVKVDWSKALTVSLEDVSVDDLLFGEG